MAANGLYNSVVGQARHPSFYLQANVPDTLDGRFDMIVLHAFVVMHRLKDGDEDALEMSQALFDEMFADMDRSLREMGVGDMGIGKRVRAMGKAFLGRTKAYQSALEADHGELAEAIMRNVYRSDEPASEDAVRLAGYVRDKIARLKLNSLDDLMQGRVACGDALPESAQ
ncbi:MAG: ubiquinol-cytochrome C chaperone family protein [Alphaproteobacteria bacterium]